MKTKTITLLFICLMLGGLSRADVSILPIPISASPNPTPCLREMYILDLDEEILDDAIKAGKPDAQLQIYFAAVANDRNALRLCLNPPSAPDDGYVGDGGGGDF